MRIVIEAYSTHPSLPHGIGQSLGASRTRYKADVNFREGELRAGGANDKVTLGKRQSG